NLHREIHILQNLSHPNIVPLLAVLTTPAHTALVLELMSGGELYHHLVSRTSFSEETARHVARQVASGVRYLHEERGVFHRDIKLENLLFEPGEHQGIGVVKIADFGLSTESRGTAQTPCGTVGYTAPEILRSEVYSRGVDMWALGVVIYSMLCGFPPFHDETPAGLSRKVSTGSYSFPSPWWDNISLESRDLIRGLLQVDPKRRLSIREMLAHPWMTGRLPAPTSRP
ncbi:kinase-like domain-containing protein, partial [Blyttiomyces helicus]